MAKRYTDNDIWKKQRWFRKLSAEYKLAFFYIKDQCDYSGIWKIDCSDLVDDLGIELFDIKDFIKKCNRDFDKINGKETTKERVKMIGNSELWITGVLQFQCGNAEGKVPINVISVKSALKKMKGFGVYPEVVDKGYVTLSEPLPKDYFTRKEPQV